AAEMEAELGIKSTYFFLLKSPFYNVLVPETFEQIVKIRDLGHTIGIHFDPVLYSDAHQGLADEIGFFQNLFGESVDIISLHRPSEIFLGNNDQICGVDHTYMPKYFNDLKYFADSSGKWRYGHPFDSAEFNNLDSLQILIHPIWWFISGGSNFDKIQKHYEDCVSQLRADFEQNSKPFREIKHLITSKY
ncbi:MAG: hypothetical protein JJ909_04735, partial [Roseivirga sp.]|nr:hypothetical protein [Roseivirga sp.]